MIRDLSAETALKTFPHGANVSRIQIAVTEAAEVVSWFYVLGGNAWLKKHLTVLSVTMATHVRKMTFACRVNVQGEIGVVMIRILVRMTNAAMVYARI